MTMAPALLLALAGMAAAATRRRRRREVGALLKRLRSPTDPPAAVAIAADAMPAPVAKYLRLVLGDSFDAPRAVELHQRGVLRTDVASRRWMRFSAVHTASPGRCGFVWNAKVQAAPFLHVRVIDSFLDGIGSGRVLLQSLYPVANDGGTAEMNSGALHRFLAEAVWYPWALLPSDRLRWQPVDERRAQATLSCGATTVALEFRFAESGEVTGIHSPGRWGRFNGRYESVPWEGHFSDYVRCGEVLLPRQGEVGWYRDGDLQLVWRGTVESVRALNVGGVVCTHKTT